MNIFEIENFFGNSSFFLLFLSMISYWIQVAFRLKTLNFGRFIMIGANFCLLSLLVLRWKESGHFPLSNLYESLMFLSWSLSTFHLILEKIESNTGNLLNLQNWLGFSNNKHEKKSNTQQNFNMNGELKTPFVGALTSPTALFTNAFATFSLPSEMQHSSALVPALQSNWLMMHVTVMILSYSALICGSLLSIAFLILTKDFDMDQDEKQLFSKAKTSVFSEKAPENIEFVSSSSVFAESLSLANGSFFEKNQQSTITNEIALENIEMTLKQKKVNSEIEFSSTNPLKKKFAETLDNLSYRILGIGFPFLTIGILSGAVWANEAWGSYWSWDPKETWALATWFVFAIYLHTRLTKGWRGKKPALIASLGFVIVWICFLGVNLLGEGLHSYGFFK